MLWHARQRCCHRHQRLQSWWAQVAVLQRPFTSCQFWLAHSIAFYVYWISTWSFCRGCRASFPRKLIHPNVRTTPRLQAPTTNQSRHQHGRSAPLTLPSHPLLCFCGVSFQFWLMVWFVVSVIANNILPFVGKWRIRQQHLMRAISFTCWPLAFPWPTFARSLQGGGKVLCLRPLQFVNCWSTNSFGRIVKTSWLTAFHLRAVLGSSISSLQWAHCCRWSCCFVKVFQARASGSKNWDEVSKVRSPMSCLGAASETTCSTGASSSSSMLCCSWYSQRIFMFTTTGPASWWQAFASFRRLCRDCCCWRGWGPNSLTAKATVKTIKKTTKPRGNWSSCHMKHDETWWNQPLWNGTGRFFRRGQTVQVMMAIDGIGVWGADAIVGKDDGGLTEGDADLRLILCASVRWSGTCRSHWQILVVQIDLTWWSMNLSMKHIPAGYGCFRLFCWSLFKNVVQPGVLVVLAFILALGINVYRDPRSRALMGEKKNQGLDTEWDRKQSLGMLKHAHSLNISKPREIAFWVLTYLYHLVPNSQNSKNFLCTVASMGPGVGQHSKSVGPLNFSPVQFLTFFWLQRCHVQYLQSWLVV